MRNFLRNVAAGLGIALSMLAVASLITPAWAQLPGQVLGQRSFEPRFFNTQQTHYLRFTLNFNSCVIAAAATTCSVKVGALPYNSFLTAVHTQIITTFNPTTSATWSLNVTGAGAGVMAAVNVFTAASTAATLTTNFTGAGELVTGSGATPTGTLGGFDLFALYTVGAAGSQGTQGQVIYIVEYIAPNDGTCAPVPLATTATAC